MASAKIIFDRKKVATSSKAKSPKKGLIQIEVLENRVRKYFSTGVSVYADQWGGPEKLVIKSAFSDEYNHAIRTTMIEVLESISKNTKNGKTELHSVRKTQKSVLLVDYIATCAERMRKYRSKSTANDIKYTGSIISRFGKNMRLETISLRSMEKLQESLLEYGYKSTTVGMIMGRVHMVVRCAVRDGILDKDPMEGFKRARGISKPRVYLTDSEVKTIESLHCDDPDTELSRKFFLLQCYTGMSRSDILTLKNNMIIEENGKYYIARPRHKTGIAYRITLLPPAYEIVKSFGFKAPVISTYKYGRRLLKIAQLAGIDKRITSHVGRHTFATWALHNGVPIEIVSRILGHTNISTTQIYAKILSEDVDAQFERLSHLMKKEAQSHD